MNKMHNIFRRIFLLLIMCIATTAYAQSGDTNEDTDFEEVVEACVKLRKAVEANDLVEIKRSAEKLTRLGMDNFSGLHAKDDYFVSLKGHLVFDEDFARQLAKGEDVFPKADEFARARVHRGASIGGNKAVVAKNYCVKRGKSVRLSFVAKGTINIAVVAEADGRLTMNLHSSNKRGKQTHYYDTDDVKLGRAYRKTKLALPNDIVNTVVLEVKNCTKRDMSFVVIKR